MRVEAPAKINLFLAAGERRADGLHELVSVMQAVSLADELRAEPAAELSLAVLPPGTAPPGDDNLVLRAARALAIAAGVAVGARLELHKRIPAAAGLGGGSADAAAALVGLNEVWRCGISRKALARIGASIGSDVAFCVGGGTAAVEGTGERVSPLPCRSPVSWVIGLPAPALSTAEVYERFDAQGGGPGLADPWETADALARGDLERLAGTLRNDLEPAAISLMPGLAEGRAALAGAGALGAVLSGSGPAWLGLARDSEHAGSIAAGVAGAFARVEVVRSLPHGPRVLAG